MSRPDGSVKLASGTTAGSLSGVLKKLGRDVGIGIEFTIGAWP